MFVCIVTHDLYIFMIINKADMICDTIKGNVSHVGNIQFWFFSINYLSIKNATFWCKPHLNQTSGFGDMNNCLKFKNIVKHKNLSSPLAPGGHSTFFQVGVCGPDFRSVGLANWHLPLKRGACERKISKFWGLWAENFQIWGLVSWKFPNFGACELKFGWKLRL